MKRRRARLLVPACQIGPLLYVIKTDHTAYVHVCCLRSVLRRVCLPFFLPWRFTYLTSFYGRSKLGMPPALPPAPMMPGWQRHSQSSPSSVNGFSAGGHCEAAKLSGFAITVASPGDVIVTVHQRGLEVDKMIPVVQRQLNWDLQYEVSDLSFIFNCCCCFPSSLFVHGSQMGQDASLLEVCSSIIW